MGSLVFLSKKGKSLIFTINPGLKNTVTDYINNLGFQGFSMRVCAVIWLRYSLRLSHGHRQWGCAFNTCIKNCPRLSRCWVSDNTILPPASSMRRAVIQPQWQEALKRLQLMSPDTWSEGGCMTRSCKSHPVRSSVRTNILLSNTAMSCILFFSISNPHVKSRTENTQRIFCSQCKCDFIWNHHSFSPRRHHKSFCLWTRLTTFNLSTAGKPRAAMFPVTLTKASVHARHTAVYWAAGNIKQTQDSSLRARALEAVVKVF